MSPSKREVGGFDGTALRLLVENSADAMLFVEGKRFVHCNQAAVDMIRCSGRDQFLSLTLRDLCPERQPDGELSSEKADRIAAEAFEKGGLRFEWVLRRIDGSEFPVEVSLTAIPCDGRRILCAVWRDITGQKEAEGDRRKENETLLAILQRSPYGVALVARNGRFLFMNQEFTSITGYTLDEIRTGRDWFRKAYPDDELRAEITRVWKTDMAGKTEKRSLGVTCKDGSLKEIEFHWAVLDDGRTTFMLADVTERKRSEELFKTVADHSPIGIYIVQNNRFRFVNPHFVRLTGYKENELIDMDALSLVVPDDRGVAREKAIQMLSGRISSAYEYRVANKAGQTQWILETVTSIQYKGERAVLANCIDITDRKQAEGKMRYMSLHDNLTELYNRAFFEEEMCRLASVRFNPVGIVICDIDGLKLINDILGHSAGDALIVAAANVIRKCFRESDIVARVGGDEFAILLPNTPAPVVESICRRIQDMIVAYNGANPTSALSISVGFATKNESSTKMSELFREADNNMYGQKLCQTQTARRAIVGMLMKALEARGVITPDRVEFIQRLVTSMGARLGLPEQAIASMEILARFRDIGEVGIPDALFKKAGILSPEELAEIHRHCEIGYRIAMSTPDLTPVADGILKHHEWWNGAGYPLGLKGDEIPLECRILAVSMAYDAMVNDRPYRKAMSPGKAVAELKRRAGTQFDPALVKVFCSVLKKGKPVPVPNSGRAVTLCGIYQ